MNALRKYLDKIKPNFEEGGKLHAFRSVFDGFETFLFVPNTTSKSGVNVHDAIDSKRIMIFVVIALLPALLFGMYNIGYQNYAAAGVDGTFWEMFGFGLLAVLPRLSCPPWWVWASRVHRVLMEARNSGKVIW